MNSAWASLLWKEWREHRWKLAALTAVVVVVPLVCSIDNLGNMLGAVVATLMFSVPLASMFIGMSVAAGEQSRGTMRFLQSLPVPRAKPAAAKLLLATVTVLAPIAMAVGVAWCLRWSIGGGKADEILINVSGQLMGPVWMLENWHVRILAAGGIAAVSFLVWMAAIGVNRSDEIRAGALGLLTILAVWVVLAFISSRVTRNLQEPAPAWYRMLAAAAPGGAAWVDARRPGEAPPWLAAHWRFLLVAVASNGAMAAVYIARFGRVGLARRQAVELPVAASEPGWLNAPRRSPFAAILWKQLRETLPLAAMGAAVIMCITVLAFLATRAPDERWRSEFRLREAVELSMGMWMMVGVFVAVVSGIGVFMDDLRPGLNQFWRSRPIDVDVWFAVKFTTGLLTTVITLALSPLIMCGVLAMWRSETLDLPDHIWPQLGLCLLIQAGLFCAAVAAMAWLRHPIYAAIASFAGLVFAAGAPDLLARSLGLTNSTFATVAIIASVVIAPIAAVVVAWQAVRHDWGWKH